MDKALLRWIICFLIVCLVVIIIVFVSSGNSELNKPHTEYKCDVKNLRLNTEIEIEKEGESFAKVSGNIFTLVTDPLTMYNSAGDKIGYAGDAYHFIAQDSHAIYVNNEFTVELIGLVNFWGQSYEIYDENQEQIGEVRFNAADTSGEMFDMDGKLIANYSSNIMFNDFTVNIATECEIDEYTVLMIFCSYYSDKTADSQ